MKQQKLTQSISLLLTAVILMMTVSCGSTETGNSTSEAQTVTSDSNAVEETAATDEPELPQKDMNGFILRTARPIDADFSWSNITFNVDEINGELLNDSMHSRNTELMEKYNFKFAETQLPGNANTDALVKSVAAGDDSYDINMVYDINISTVMTYVTTWDEIPYIQPDKPWWNPDATNTFCFSGKYYAVAGNYTLGYLSRAMCYLFNKRIYDSLGLNENIYRLVKDKQWTTDKFIEIAQKAKLDLNGDGTFDENDQYGVFGNNRAYMNTMLAGAGVSYVKKGENGLFEFALDKDTRGIGLLEKFISYSALDLDLNKGAAAYDIMPDKLFENGKALFHVQGLPHSIVGLRAMEDEFGIIPLPLADENQSQYYTTSYGSLAGLLPKTLNQERFENIGIIMEAMTYTTYKEIVPIYKEDLIKTKYSRDAESLEMLDIMFNTITFDPGTLLWCGSIADDICVNTFMKGNTDIVSYLTKKLPTYQKLIEDFNSSVSG